MKPLVHVLSDQVLPNAIATALSQPDQGFCLDTGRFTAQVARLAAASRLLHRSAPYQGIHLVRQVARQQLAQHVQTCCRSDSPQVLVD